VEGQEQRGVTRYIVTTLPMNIGPGVAVGLALWRLTVPNPYPWRGLTVVLECIPYPGAACVIGLLAQECWGAQDISKGDEPESCSQPAKSGPAADNTRRMRPPQMDRSREGCGLPAEQIM
jgi:hypothetical protein